MDASQFMQPGQSYRLTFEPVGLVSYLEHPDMGALQSALLGVPLIASANLTVATPVQAGGTDLYSVDFTYTGDGSDVAAQVIQAIIDAWNASTSVTWQFVGFAVQQQDQSGGLHLPGLGFTGASSSSMWAIVLLVLLGVFLFYGGGSLVKKGIKAAS